jgi:hypothetical protein
MISPNAGKVLLGADGNPLRGAAGGIVLADNLYPTKAFPTGWEHYASPSFMSPNDYPYTPMDGWSRNQQQGSQPTYPDFQALLGSATWAPSTTVPFARLGVRVFNNDGWHNSFYQTCIKYPITGWTKLPGTSVDPVWSRAKAIRLHWYSTLYRGYTLTPAINFKYTIGLGDSVVLPQGTNEPWEGAGWHNLGAGVGETSGTFDIAFDESVGNLYIAIWADSPASPLVVYEEMTFFISRFEVVYNLAEPTP